MLNEFTPILSNFEFSQPVPVDESPYDEQLFGTKDYLDPFVLNPSSPKKKIYYRYMYQDEYAAAATLYYIFYPYEKLEYDEETYKNNWKELMNSYSLSQTDLIVY